MEELQCAVGLNKTPKRSSRITDGRCALTMEKALAIQLSSGEHVGFVLFSGGPSAGECIFQVLPREADAFDDPAFKFLEDYGFRIAGEHRWESDGDKILLTLSTGRTAVVHMAGENLTFDSGPEYKIRRK